MPIFHYKARLLRKATICAVFVNSKNRTKIFAISDFLQ